MFLTEEGAEISELLRQSSPGKQRSRRFSAGSRRKYQILIDFEVQKKGR